MGCREVAVPNSFDPIPTRTNADGIVDRSTIPAVSREQVAEFMLGNEDRIRRIARSKLTSMCRTLFDSEDVFSSVLRQVDALATRGDLRPQSEVELWALIATVTRNNAVSKVRLTERARSLIRDDGEYAQALSDRIQSCENDGDVAALCVRLMTALESGHDRQLFALRLRGVAHQLAAELLGISEVACRQRWHVIRNRLAVIIRADLNDRTPTQ